VAAVGLVPALLIAVWYYLSDVKLAEALDDRSSFRRFCGFSSSDETPERTAFVRFRTELIARGLDKALFDAVTRPLKAKAVTVKTGTLVDATVIGSASHGDGEGRLGCPSEAQSCAWLQSARRHRCKHCNSRGIVRHAGQCS
jgi:IS5 family transposase